RGVRRQGDFGGLQEASSEECRSNGARKCYPTASFCPCSSWWLWSRKGVARTFGALAGFVLADLPVSRARVFGFLLAFCHVAPWLGCRGRWQPSEGGEQHRLRSR
ncbi:unnamed protein product, partial [Bubo scandiacus]